MGRYRKNTSNRWYSRTADRPLASIYPLSRFDRPKITKINYIKSHPCRPLLPWEPLRESAEHGVHIIELAGLIEWAASLGQGLEWQTLLKPRPFPAAEPTKPLMPAQPEALQLPAIRPPKLKPLPPPPVKGAVRLRPTFWQRLLPGRFEKAVRGAQAKVEQYYDSDRAAWEEQVASIKRKNEAALRAHEEAKEKQLLSAEALHHSKAVKHWLEQAQLLEQEFAAARANWVAAKEKFSQQASAERELIASLHQRYLAGEREAIAIVTTLVLRMSAYPDAFPRSVEVQYKPENRIAIINFQLPDFQAIEIVRAKTKVGQKERTQLVEQTLYAIAIRTLSRLCHPISSALSTQSSSTAGCIH